MKFQNNGQKILRGYRNKHTGMWEVSFLTTQCKEPTTAIAKNVLAQATRSELESYHHAALLSPTNTSLLKAIKKVF